MIRPIAIASAAALTASMLAGCGGASAKCEGASDYVWLVDYPAKLVSGEEGAARSFDRDTADQFLKSMSTAIDALDKDGPKSLDDDLATMRVVWKITVETMSDKDGDIDQMAAAVNKAVPGGTEAATNAGKRIVSWAKKNCSDEDGWGDKPKGFKS